MSSNNVSSRDTATTGMGARIKSLHSGERGALTAFAVRCAIPKQQLIKYEKEISEPKISALISLAKAGATTIDWIVRGGDQPTSPAQNMLLELRDVTDRESTFFIPLIRAALELSRKSDEQFETWLRETRLHVKGVDLDLAPIDTAIEQFQRVKGKAPDVTPSTRKPRAAKGLHPK